MSVREDLEHPADDDAPHRRPEVSSRVGEVPGDGRQLAVLGAQHQRQHATVVAQRGVGERPTGGGGGDRRRRRVLVTEQLRQRPPLVVHGSSAAEQLDIDLSLCVSPRQPSLDSATKATHIRLGRRTGLYRASCQPCSTESTSYDVFATCLRPRRTPLGDGLTEKNSRGAS